MSCSAESTDCIFSDNAEVAGLRLDAARAEHFSRRFSAAHEPAPIHCVSELQGVVVVGEVAYTPSRDTLSTTPHAGTGQKRFVGYRSTAYRKQPDDRWVLARDTHTLARAE